MPARAGSLRRPPARPPGPRRTAPRCRPKSRSLRRLPIPCARKAPAPCRRWHRRARASPAIGAYWLRPSRMCSTTRSTRRVGGSKSGKPCDRLIAPHSAASRDMTVKIVVPTFGSFDGGSIGGRGELTANGCAAAVPGRRGSGRPSRRMDAACEPTGTYLRRVSRILLRPGTCRPRVRSPRITPPQCAPPSTLRPSPHR